MDKNNQSSEVVFVTNHINDKKEKVAHFEKEKKVIPIIFIPGIMGSNLMDKNGKEVIWRLDSIGFDGRDLYKWSLYRYGGAKRRYSLLNKDRVRVDKRGKVTSAIQSTRDKLQKRKDNWKSFKFYSEDDSIDSEIDSLEKNLERDIKEKIKTAELSCDEIRLFGDRALRGWGSVSYISYNEYLCWLQNSLLNKNSNNNLNSISIKHNLPIDDSSNDNLFIEKDQINHCSNFHLPVHAFGYNWLESNAESALKLKKYIDIELPKYYKKLGLKCDKVILITHSMGGLVARYYSEKMGGKNKVLGVIHGVMPSIGAPAAYARMKRGTEIYSSKLEIENFVTREILGADAKEVTAVCANAPGPLELLPSSEYNKWLRVVNKPQEPKIPNEEELETLKPEEIKKLAKDILKDLRSRKEETEQPKEAPELPNINVYGNILYSKPEKNPYDEIYLNKNDWWGLCEPHLINPLNHKNNIKLMEKDWMNYVKKIKNVKSFHENIAFQYHANTYLFYGEQPYREGETIKKAFRTYSGITWNGFDVNSDRVDYVPSSPPKHIGCKSRVTLDEIKEIRTIRVWDPLSNANMTKQYILAEATGNGDGTVPVKSGKVDMRFLKARMPVPVEHEGAYKFIESKIFSLRSIVKILNTYN